MERATYKVEGMSCGGCVSSVTRALNAALPGVQVVVQLEPGIVTIEGAHEMGAVKQAIEDAGFDFAGAQPSAS